MKKKFIVKNQRDFTKIIKSRKFVKNNVFVIYYLNNEEKYDRFGVSVGTKLGNAVFRNKYKRKIRAIVDNYKKTKKDYVNYKDYIIILREKGSNLSYKELEENFVSLMNIIRKEDKIDK